MNDSEKDLQNKIQQGLAHEDSVDAKLYRNIFNTLSEEPYVLPAEFAERVTKRIEARVNNSRDYVWFVIGLAFFVLATVVTLIYSSISIDLTFFAEYSGKRGLVVFGVIAVVLIQYFDKVLVKRNNFRYKQP